MDSYMVPLAVVIFAIILWMALQRRAAAVRHILNMKKHSRENSAMKELAKQFIGKACIIYTVASVGSGIQGTIKEVSDGGLIVEKEDGVEAVNLEYVTRIREWPRNAKGKKKMLFD